MSHKTVHLAQDLVMESITTLHGTHLKSLALSLNRETNKATVELFMKFLDNKSLRGVKVETFSVAARPIE
jgi:hypothetical protein